MWNINNSLDVTRAPEERKISLRKVSTWDFSTLYTNSQYAKLKNQPQDLLESVFNTRGAKELHCHQ